MAAFLALPFLVTQVEGAVIFKAAAAKLGIGKKKVAPKVAQKWRPGTTQTPDVRFSSSFPRASSGGPKIGGARQAAANVKRNLGFF